MSKRFLLCTRPSRRGLLGGSPAAMTLAELPNLNTDIMLATS